MKEIKHYRLTKALAVISSLLLVLAFAVCVICGNSFEPLTAAVTGFVQKTFKLELTPELLGRTRDYAFLVGTIAGVLTFVFMCSAFATSGRVIKELYSAHPVQTTVHVSDSKEAKKMKKQAEKNARLEAKEKGKVEKEAKKKEKKAAKNVTVQVNIGTQPKPAQKEARNQSIDDILSGLK